jgi:hypothetical protein
LEQEKLFELKPPLYTILSPEFPNTKSKEKETKTETTKDYIPAFCCLYCVAKLLYRSL